MSGEGGELMPEWRGEDSPRRSLLRPRRLLRLSGRTARDRRFLAGDNNARNVVCCFGDPAELDTATMGPQCWVSFIGAAARATHTRVNQRTGRNTSKGFASSVVLKTGSQPSGTPIRGASCPRSSVMLFSECYLSVRLVSSST